MFHQGNGSQPEGMRPPQGGGHEMTMALKKSYACHTCISRRFCMSLDLRITLYQKPRGEWAGGGVFKGNGTKKSWGTRPKSVRLTKTRQEVDDDID